MIKITSTLTEEKKQEVRDSRKAPGHPMKDGLLTIGKEYYLKIRVTDDITAEHVLLGLLHNPNGAVEGHELLGFTLQEIAWGGIGRLQTYQEELSRFINTELEQRVKERENTNI